MERKKIFAGLEFVLIVVSMFAFADMVSLSEPIVPVVSAANDMAGCCYLNNDGEFCGLSIEDECVSGNFAEGAQCQEVDFCREVCCYDDASGTYDKNVLKSHCEELSGFQWDLDANCNMVGANLGCCVLEDGTRFITRGQCDVLSSSFGIGSDSGNWKGDLNSGQCAILANPEGMGACVLRGGSCDFATGEGCVEKNGAFYEGSLCTNPELDTICKKTEETVCFGNKVYFTDSCGNRGNIYDSRKFDSEDYWSVVVDESESCGAGLGNGDSLTCGNCNQYLGGICSSSLGEGVSVDVGNFYCKDSSCEFRNVKYNNGESWCVYDGVIGDGNDVVGSTHWIYECSQGDVNVNNCGDSRTGICVQSNTLDEEGGDVVFRKASCMANNWKECAFLNSEEDGMEDCAEAVNCRVETVDLADHFKFDVCLPEYPGGLVMTGENAEVSAEATCGMATLNCTAVRSAKLFGGCSWEANKQCLDDSFLEGMNEVCRQLGDCGGEVNIEGVYSENFEISRDDGRVVNGLSQGILDDLKRLATPRFRQYAEVEDYSKYLETAGLMGGGGENDVSDNVMRVSAGVGGIALAAYYIVAPAVAAIGNTGIDSLTFSEEFTSASSEAAIPYTGTMMAAGIGMVGGAMLAKHLNKGEKESYLLAGLGGLVVAGTYYGVAVMTMLEAAGWFGWYVVLAAVVAIIASVIFGDDCDPIEVSFECKPWQPPVGGDDCEKCNEDPILKPCSEYRCASLGAACELVNIGSDNEMCQDSGDDGVAPIIDSRDSVISDELKYVPTNTGFKVSAENGGCLEANSFFYFGITTDELAQCRWDYEMVDFEDMGNEFGGNFYKYNHTVSFNLPDPAHGQSQGLDFSDEYTLYVKCRDTHDHVSPTFYTVEMCVNQGDDVTGPRVVVSDPVSGGLIGFDSLGKNVSIVLNEPLTCRWDVADLGYSSMANNMTCEESYGAKRLSTRGFSCVDEFPTPNANNKYYIKCFDQPWLENIIDRNVGSFVYELRKPERKISIDWIKPDSDWEINTPMTGVDFEVMTSGGAGEHVCSYSFSGYDKMIRLFISGEAGLHKTPLNRPSGETTFYVECEDETGDSVRGNSSFTILYDGLPPEVARVWQSGSSLYVVTPEEAECRYSLESCNFNWANGTTMGTGLEHSVSVGKSETYHIKCGDKFENVPSDCSIEVKSL